MIKLEDVERGYARWAGKSHNAKWVRKIDGTPIANDICVNIFEELESVSPSPVSADAVVEAATAVLKDWDERMPDGPEERKTLSDSDHKYWSPNASMVSSEVMANLRAALKGTFPAVDGWRTMDSAPTGDEIIEVSRYPDYARWNASRFLRTHADHLTLFRWRHPAAPSTQEADHDNG